MSQFTQNAQDTETSSQYAGIRLAELIDQNWSRNKSDHLAIERGEDEGMIVHQDATSNIHNSKDLNDITTR